MKKEIKIKAPAKVNIALDVLGVREDGYHEMRMINHTVALADELHFSLEDTGIVLSCSDPKIPVDAGNIVWRVAECLKTQFGVEAGVAIAIDKHIPSEAGLAGGSADGAAALLGLNRLWGLGLSLRELCAIGAKIGADIPYCCFKGTALVTGIGEIITPLKPLNRLSVVLVKPDIDIATPWAFRQLDAGKNTRHPDIDGVISAIELEDYDALRVCSGNAFETAVFEIYPEIRDIKEKMYDCGAVFSVMSGSGSTVIGYFEAEAAARRACTTFKQSFPHTFLTEIE